MSVRQTLLTWRRPATDLCLLTWASGVMDALSYLRAGVFTANMTGNTVILGVAMVGPGRSRVPFSILAICAFTFGALVAGIILVRRPSRQWAADLSSGMALQLPFAILFTVLWALSPAGGGFGILAMLTTTAACALGIQSVAVRRLKISGAVTTFITGTITTAIVSLLERKEPGAIPGKEERSSPVFLASMLFLYILAALAGGCLALVHSRWAGLAATMPIAAVFIRSLKKQ